MIDDITESDLGLLAMRLKSTALQIVPSNARRPWMDATIMRFANRCLPLLIANQSGWDILSDCAFTATWTGGDEATDTTITFDEPSTDAPESHFGYGILTWSLPFLFRTPAGWNLLARGPANAPKDGVAALEGITETDWTYTPFTMNWKLTRANFPVRFERGDVICTIVPQRRAELERFRPELCATSDVPEMAQKHREWSASRRAFAADPANRTGWQKHYFRGEAPWGEQAPEHDTRLRLRPFEEFDQRQGSTRDAGERHADPRR